MILLERLPRIWDVRETLDSKVSLTWLWGWDDPLRVNEQVRKSILYIGVLTGTSFVPYGTAFIGAMRIGNGHAKGYIITARHVLEDIRTSKSSPVVRINTRNGEANYAVLGDEWAFHPTIKHCDVAVSGFAADDNLFDYRAVDLDSGVMTPEFAAENDIGAGDEVFTTGLLVSHFGATKNVPIVRVGNIAAMLEGSVDLGSHLGSQDVYLIESRSTGGLSGSPVYFHTPPIKIVNRVAKNMNGYRSEYLLGVNIGLFETSVHGDLLPTDVQDRRERFLETMSAGIAVVIPIQRVLEILNTEQFKKQRDDAMTLHDVKVGFRATSAADVSKNDAVEKVQSASKTDNPSHKEDFTRLLGAAVKAKPPTS